jgi:alpha-tubulin suppressor-like RCC1 family protein
VADAGFVDKPTPVSSLIGLEIVQLSASAQHMLALDAFGRVYACGRTSYGRLTLDGSPHVTTPKLLTSLLHVPMKQVVAAPDHSLALSTNGDVFMWGRVSPRSNGFKQAQLVENLSVWKRGGLKIPSVSFYI